jgi:hypothetical protein
VKLLSDQTILVPVSVQSFGGEIFHNLKIIRHLIFESIFLLTRISLSFYFGLRVNKLKKVAIFKVTKFALLALECVDTASMRLTLFIEATLPLVASSLEHKSTILDLAVIEGALKVISVAPCICACAVPLVV